MTGAAAPAFFRADRAHQCHGQGPRAGPGFEHRHPGDETQPLKQDAEADAQDNGKQDVPVPLGTQADCYQKKPERAPHMLSFPNKHKLLLPL